METNRGKEAFAAIEIPEELEAAVDRGLRRGRRRTGLACGLTGLAAAVLLVFMTANVPPLYAGAAEVPLFGNLVRIMHVGSGGQAVEGVRAQAVPGENTLGLTFADGEGDAAPVPRFSAARRELPRRVTLRLHGMAPDSLAPALEALEAMEAVSGVWPLAATDPAEQGFTVQLAPGWALTVGQYPNRLELGFLPDEAEKASGYVLCSPPMDFGPTLAELTERLLWEGATQMHTENGCRVLVGEYRTRDQAERARAGIAEARQVELEIGEVTGGVLRVGGSN